MPRKPVSQTSRPRRAHTNGHGFRVFRRRISGKTKGMLYEPLRWIEVNRQPGGDVVLARLSGDVDLAQAPRIQADLIAATSNAALGVVLDLTDVHLFDSSGVRLLFEMQRRLEQSRQQLRLVVPETAPVRRVLAIVNMDKHIRVHPSLDAALADFPTAADVPTGTDISLGSSQAKPGFTAY